MAPLLNWQPRSRSALWVRGRAALRVSVFSLAIGPWLASSGWAGLADWKPVLAQSHAKLSLQSSYTKEDKKNSDKLSSRRARQGFRESLALQTLGYAYHPDMMFFDFSAGYGEDQATIDNGDDSRSSRGGFQSYDFNSLFFRKKPYTLSMFSTQDKPFSNSLYNVANEGTKETGADFNYLKRIYNAKVKYKNSQSTLGGTPDMTNSYEASGDYSKTNLGWLENFSTNIMARYQDEALGSVSTNHGGTLTMRNGVLSNQFAYKPLTFATTVSNYASDSSFGSFRGMTDGNTLGESIYGELPWDLTSKLRAITSTANESFHGEATGQDSAKKKRNLEFSMAHKLYESLETSLFIDNVSEQTTRADSLKDVSGAMVNLNPVQGVDDSQGYQLETLYTKRLPRESTLTASLSTQDRQINRTGLSTEVSLYMGVMDDSSPSIIDRTINLPDTADTNTTIAVEVLRVNLTKHPNDPCKIAVQNPRSLDTACWAPLHENINYKMHRGTIPPTIVIDAIDDALGAAYYDLDQFKNDDLTYGPFTFRVTHYRKAVDATTQTNRASTGIDYMHFLSSKYSHTESTQQGNYGGYLLSPKVITDSVGITLTDGGGMTANATRQWNRAITLETITQLRIDYAYSKKFFERLDVIFHANGKKGFSDTTDNAGTTATSTEEGYSYSIDGKAPIAYLDAALTLGNSYGYTQGQLSNLTTTSEGLIIPSQDLGINKSELFSTRAGVTKNFKIPRTELQIGSKIQYEWQTMRGDTSSHNSRLQYGVTAGRVWKFGATTINFTANYNTVDQVFNEEDSFFSLSNGNHTTRQREEETNISSVMLKVVRQLF